MEGFEYVEHSNFIVRTERFVKKKKIKNDQAFFSVFVHIPYEAVRYLKKSWSKEIPYPYVIIKNINEYKNI